ncbi:MAG: four-carbon acid sugar kinase family protein, partial [Microterricola sp.]
SGLPVVTQWRQSELAWAFEQNGHGVCVLTNTRSLETAEARARNAEAMDSVHAAAQGEPYAIISRGDSTLRGHYADELDVVQNSLRDNGWGAVDAVLLVPAFPDAGRITVDAVHWVQEGGGLVPAGESSFARDSTFGYDASDLRDWVEEQSRGVIPAADVAVINLDLVRRGHAELVAAIMDQAGGKHVVIDAVDDNDLRCIAIAAIAAEALGHKIVYRTSPGLLRARLAQPSPEALSREVVAAAIAASRPATTHGLVIVGSHVPLSSRQLAHLVSGDPGIEHLVLDVPSLLSAGCSKEVTSALIDRAARLLHGRDVVISTSRARVDGADPSESLRIAREVSSALVEIASALLARSRPSYLIGKGGITSSDLATRGVGLTRATIRGSLLPGLISIWQGADGTSTFSTPYAIFPGNVGSESSLSDAVAAFRAAANSTG